MANIGVRSPYFIYYQETGTSLGGLTASYATMTINVGSSTPYIITKYNGDQFLLDISELIRDFVNPYYSGSISAAGSAAISFNYSLQFYDAEDAIVGDPKTNTHKAYDAYHYFTEGNTIDGNESGFAIPNSTVLLSGPVIWYPQDTAGNFLYFDASGNLQSQPFGTTDSEIVMFEGTADETTIYIRRLACSKYDANKLVFINKFGVLQELWFTAKTTEGISVMSDKFKSGFVTTNGAINRFRHQRLDYNKNGQIRYTLNTTYICEGVTRYIQELLLSELVWLQLDGNFYPVNVTTSNVQYKNSVNDKLVNYTIEVEQANDLISSIR
jgi:hypothetical protein